MTTDPAAQRGSRWVIRAWSCAARHIDEASGSSSPNGPARIAAPLPAYGAGVPDFCHDTPSSRRKAAVRVPRPAPPPAAHETIRQSGQQRPRGPTREPAGSSSAARVRAGCRRCTGQRDTADETVHRLDRRAANRLHTLERHPAVRLRPRTPMRLRVPAPGSTL